MHINCYEQTSHLQTSHLYASHLHASHLHASHLHASHLHASLLHASLLQSVHIKKEPSPVKEKTLSGYVIPGCRRSARLPQIRPVAADPSGCRRSALLHQSSLRYMASPKLKKR